MPSKKEIPTYTFASAKELEDFLDQHHSKLQGLWIDHALKSSGVPSVNTFEARQVIICFGWIDGFSTSHQPGRRKVRYSPRREESTWSRKNKEHAQLMIDQGRMRPSGFAAIEAAKADGRWEKEEGTIRRPSEPKRKPQPKTKLEPEANPKRRREQAEDIDESKEFKVKKTSVPEPKESKVKKASKLESKEQKKTPLRRSLRKKS